MDLENRARNLGPNAPTGKHNAPLPLDSASSESTHSQPQPEQSTQQPELGQAAEGEEDEELKGQKNLDHARKLEIVRTILQAGEDPKTIIKALENSIPQDMALNWRSIQSVLHPDRWRSPEEKEEAQKAFQTIKEAEQRSGAFLSGSADGKTQFFYGNDGDRPEEHTAERLSSYHKKAHEDATPHLAKICQGIEANPNSKSSDWPSAVEGIDNINGKIQNDNIKLKKDPKLGHVDYERFCAMWRAVFKMPETHRSAQMGAIREMCKQSDYPSGWANCPPSSDKYFSRGTAPKSSGRAKASGQSHSSGFLQTSGQPQPTGPTQSEGKPQAADQSQASAPPQHLTDSPNNLQLYNASAGGQIRTISVRPRTIVRSVKPGYTSSGEKIVMIQPMGTSYARFVVEDGQGMRLVSSTAAGGNAALYGAQSVGIPETVRRETEIENLRDRVRGGGTYGLKFVALGEWDPRKERLPFIVVGFYHQSPSLPEVEVGISRSALRKVLAPREADRLIAESMVGDPNISLKEALLALSPAKQEELFTQTPPLGLPASQQNPFPWPNMPQMPQQNPFQQIPASSQKFQPPPSFPTTFFNQQFPSHMAFQSPYAQYPQQNPFIAPYQPVIDPYKQGHAFESSTLQPEEEEL